MEAGTSAIRTGAVGTSGPYTKFGSSDRLWRQKQARRAVSGLLGLWTGIASSLLDHRRGRKGYTWHHVFNPSAILQEPLHGAVHEPKVRLAAKVEQRLQRIQRQKGKAGRSEFRSHKNKYKSF